MTRLPPLAPMSWSPTLAEAKFLDRDEGQARWSAAVRSAARAVFPRQTVELGRAAYVAAFFVIAGRLEEDNARVHLHKAASAAGVGPQEAERVIEKGFCKGRAHALAETLRDVEGHSPGTSHHPPGAFTAVASGSETYDHVQEMFVDPGGLDLGPAALVHRGHDNTREAIGIGIPTRRDGVVRFDAVFSSFAGETWTLVRKGRLRSVSISAHCTEYHRGLSGRLTRGTLIAVDLVRTPADARAVVGDVVDGTKLTPGQRRTQQLLNEYLANPSNPFGIDLMLAAERHGVEVLDVLAPIVAPLRAERGGHHLAAAG